jgi:hypothetical protein
MMTCPAGAGQGVYSDGAAKKNKHGGRGQRVTRARAVRRARTTGAT